MTTDNDALVRQLEFELRDWSGARMAMETVSLKLIAEAAAAIRHLSAELAKAEENINIKADWIEKTINDMAATDADNARLREALEVHSTRLGIIRVTHELEGELDDRISLVQKAMLKALQENDRG